MTPYGRGPGGPLLYTPPNKGKPLADSYLRVQTVAGTSVGIGEVVPATDEGGDGRLYLLGEGGTHTVFNMRHVIQYFYRPLTEEEQRAVDAD
ncbi:hypothetical protein M045_gp44 [Mycobacterium phage HINdeR]|uniref:Uncharacterized protein n=1 Tax=Mycobacterium phage HINdeR TaxID=1327770 RepID=R4JEX0_9CAUD|nr:hypothetical protein M045_gp44 [Mycobacterium phage HINdeR]AGK87523.1 hypothetical protein PBI_HINDER_44 [Mycobacterium phage HINdeR]